MGPSTKGKEADAKQEEDLLQIRVHPLLPRLLACETCSPPRQGKRCSTVSDHINVGILECCIPEQKGSKNF